MRRTWPIIGVKNVTASSLWYRELLGLGPIEPDSHPDFDQLRDDDAEGTILLCLHEWGGHDEGPPLASPDAPGTGNGLLLSFLVEDFEHCVERARGLNAEFQQEPQYPDGWFKSFMVRDPDGYHIAVNSMQDIRALEAGSRGAT